MGCEQYNIGLFKGFIIFINLIQSVSFENVLLVRVGDECALKKKIEYVKFINAV